MVKQQGHLTVDTPGLDTGQCLARKDPALPALGSTWKTMKLMVIHAD